MRDLHGTLSLRRAYETERRVEVERPNLERELGPFEVAVDDDGRCIVSTASGAQFEARLSSRHADARLVVEEVSA